MAKEEPFQKLADIEWDVYECKVAQYKQPEEV